MIVRLGEVVCDPVITALNDGVCSDSAGNMLTQSGAVAPLQIDHAANDPNYSMTVTASAGSPGFLGLDPKTLALILGALLVFLLVRNTKR